MKSRPVRATTGPTTFTRFTRRTESGTPGVQDSGDGEAGDHNEHKTFINKTLSYSSHMRSAAYAVLPDRTRVIIPVFMA